MLLSRIRYEILVTCIFHTSLFYILTGPNKIVYLGLMHLKCLLRLCRLSIVYVHYSILI